MLGSHGIRTDLALEATERFTEENVEVRGVEVTEDYNEEKDIRTTIVKITTENGARTMGRPQGNYITIEAPGLSVHDEDYHREISAEIARHLQKLINLDASALWHAGGDHRTGLGLLFAQHRRGHHPRRGRILLGHHRPRGIRGHGKHAFERGRHHRLRCQCC